MSGDIRGAAVFLGATILGLFGMALRRKRPGRPRLDRRPSDFEGADAGPKFEIVKPPLPPEVVHLLESTSLCHLSTQSRDNAPHLSLMRFTYLQSEEKILLSTRRNTQKFAYLSQNPKVALLVHDFPNVQGGERSAEEGGRTYSITLNGVAQVEGGDAAEAYRRLHLKNNSDYSQFIVGEEIAIISVHVDTARICNIDDKVKFWSSRPPQKDA